MENSTREGSSDTDENELIVMPKNSSVKSFFNFSKKLLPKLVSLMVFWLRILVEKKWLSKIFSAWKFSVRKFFRRELARFRWVLQRRGFRLGSITLARVKLSGSFSFFSIYWFRIFPPSFPRKPLLRHSRAGGNLGKFQRVLIIPGSPPTRGWRDD